MPPAKVDYRIIERDYVTTELTYRDLEDKYHVAFSAISRYGREHDWPRKREEYRRQAMADSISATLEKLAEQAADVRVESVTAMRATLYEYLQNLKDHKVTVGTKEAVQAIQTLQLLLGEPTERRETKIVTDPWDGANPSELRELLAFTRARLVEGTADEIAGPAVGEAGEG
jgi:hypothetical protein